MKTLQKRLSTTREKRNLKNKAKVKVASKTDYIRKLLLQDLTPSDVRKRMEKRGLGVYPSEIYRVKAQLS